MNQLEILFISPTIALYYTNAYIMWVSTNIYAYIWAWKKAKKNLAVNSRRNIKMSTIATHVY